MTKPVNFSSPSPQKIFSLFPRYAKIYSCYTFLPLILPFWYIFTVRFYLNFFLACFFHSFSSSRFHIYPSNDIDWHPLPVGGRDPISYLDIIGAGSMDRYWYCRSILFGMLITDSIHPLVKYFFFLIDSIDHQSQNPCQADDHRSAYI